MRVLLIEDEPTTARAIELMLTTEGFNVYSTDLGEEGLDLGKLDLKKHAEDHIVVVPIASLNKAVIGALQYAQSIGGLVYALNVSTDKESMEKLKCQWQKLDTDIILLAEYSPYREVMNPLVKYISMLVAAAEQHERVTVIVPQFITHGTFDGILHNHTGFLLHEALLKNDNIVVATYPYHLKSYEEKEAARDAAKANEARDAGPSDSSGE